MVFFLTYDGYPLENMFKLSCTETKAQKKSARTCVFTFCGANISMGQLLKGLKATPILLVRCLFLQAGKRADKCIWERTSESIEGKEIIFSQMLLTKQESPNANVLIVADF